MQQAIDQDQIIRLPAEIKWADELEALRQNDNSIKPVNWLLSPSFVLKFVMGTNEEFTFKSGDKINKITISQKFFGDHRLVEKAIVTLLSDRGLLLLGDPGTGKSWLSEHISAAVSGQSTLLIQGSAGTTEEQIRYGWNIALMIAEGPSMNTLIKTPTLVAMEKGKILRFEEITRCLADVQDSLVSLLSEKSMAIPELTGRERIIFATKGFNIIATANTRDKGVNELSSALKRRFNYIILPNIENIRVEMEIVEKRTTELMENANIQVEIPPDIIEILVTTFREMRSGLSSKGISLKKPSTVMSTADEISTLYDSALYAYYYSKNKKKIVTPKHLALNLLGTVVKENEADLKALQEYFTLVVKQRRDNKLWKEYYEAGLRIFSNYRFQ